MAKRALRELGELNLVRTPAEWVLVGLVALVAYELVRFLIVRRVRRWWAEGAVRFLRRHRVRLESARFIDRVWIRERLAQDAEIEAAIAREAKRTQEPVKVLRRRADAYGEEIAPFFSISAYYRLGAALAKRLVDFCFELVMEPKAFERQAAKVPADAVRVYVINHRSNTDSVVLSYGLLRQIALSYAVGEWALVWPLHTLFRMFGSYFVRRGEKDPLYHAVLERFVQILAGHGGVTGFYLEGGLSRDGALRKPKSGLLEYIVKIRCQDPGREIVFLPVGLNYDRVLEDRHLVSERDGPRPKLGVAERLVTLGGIAFWAPLLIGANLLRVATRSHRKFGYAAVAFGEPLRLTEWPGGAAMHDLPPDERRDAVRALAVELLERRVGSVIPATPVPLLCAALLEGAARESELSERVAAKIAELRRVGAPVALGAAFETIRVRRAQGETTAMPGLDEAVLDFDEAQLVVTLAAGALARRGLVSRDGDRLSVVPAEVPIVAYYANSIRHHLAARTEAA